jgi:CDP-glucose 4,6-dehydratase
MEGMVIDPAFFRGRRVLVTGHTGFKGAWCCLVLRSLGADVYGFALPADGEQGIFVAADVLQDIDGRIGDIRDNAALVACVRHIQPHIIIHMAAQALVRESYDDPVQTFATNVLGTVHVLEAARHCAQTEAVVIVTSDKCYENDELARHAETDRLGGRDPYSNSKACAELVTDSYRRSFFQPLISAAVATVRAGNVIGGGDWSRDRLVPDAIRAFLGARPLEIRNAGAVRPWQHVLDPVLAYIGLAQRLCVDGKAHAQAWNFGPGAESEVPVSNVVDRLAAIWGGGARWTTDSAAHPHESPSLRLDCSKAESALGWKPIIDLDRALELTAEWYRAQAAGRDMRAFSMLQVGEALERSAARPVAA